MVPIHLRRRLIALPDDEQGSGREGRKGSLVACDIY